MVDRSFLGRGLAFPVKPDDDGQLAMASGEIDIEQSIRVILGTARGERVMRPDFGCGIHNRLFDSMNTHNRSLMEQDVRDALVAWEPRIDVDGVAVTAPSGREATVLVEIDYTVRSTNTAENLVYPFYLEE
jgi:phage baseplate assembly protein W